MLDSFDAIMKAAQSYAKSSNQSPFRSLVEGFGYKDPIMILNLMKFVNQMIGNVERDKKRLSKFVANLQNVGIFDVLQLLKKSESEEIKIQIRSFEAATK